MTESEKRKPYVSPEITHEFKYFEWSWGGEVVTAAWGHIDKDAFRRCVITVLGLGDDDPVNVAHRWVCRDPDRDGMGDADEAWRLCDPHQEGARAITMEQV